MIIVPNASMHLWTIGEWICRPGSHDFSIWASPDFLKAASKSCISHARLQELARMHAKDAGLRVSESHDLLHFNKWGICQFDWPGGGGRWINLVMNESSNFRIRGGEYSTHNVDTTIQQSFLFSLWLMWVKAVELKINDDAQKKKP